MVIPVPHPVPIVGSGEFAIIVKFGYCKFPPACTPETPLGARAVLDIVPRTGTELLIKTLEVEEAR